MNTFLVITSFVMQVVTYSFFMTAVGNKLDSSSITKTTLTISISIIISAISNWLKFIFPINTIISLLLVFLVFKYNYSLSKTKSAILIITIFIFQLLAEILVISLLNLTDFNILSLYNQISVVISLFTITLIYIYVKFILQHNRLYISLKALSSKHIIFTLAILCIFILPQTFILTFHKYNIDAKYIAISFMQILFSTIFTIFYLKLYLDKDILSKDFKVMELSIDNLTTMIDGVRTIKHDFNNIFQSINGYILTKKYDELDTYVASVMNECHIINTLSIINKDAFNEPAIYGVIGSKHFLSIEQGIKFEIDSTVDYTTIDFPMPNLSRILGILIDNAMEACLKSEEKYIRIEVKYNTLKEATVFRIYNTIANDITIDLSKIYDKGYSTKEVKSGIGLWEVKKLIKRQKNSQIFASIENNKFLQTIIIEDKI